MAVGSGPELCHCPLSSMLEEASGSWGVALRYLGLFEEVAIVEVGPCDVRWWRDSSNCGSHYIYGYMLPLFQDSWDMIQDDRT